MILIATFNFLILAGFVAVCVAILAMENSRIIKTRNARACPICYEYSQNIVICCDCLNYICVTCYIRKLTNKCPFCRG